MTQLRVNGRTHSVDVDPGTLLLYVLRNDLELDGPKFGCGLAQCGACTVLVQGQAVRSCVTPVSSVQDKDIVTLEGLGGPGRVHPMQMAFQEEQAAQCGYCINGMIMTVKSFLDRESHPTEERIREVLSGILCRCGTHLQIVRAVQRAAKNSGTP
jgi:nicotinate dehydrogenase subunit A